MTREPPLNCVGVRFAASAPLAVSKTSLATFRPRCTQAPAISVSTAGHQCHSPCSAATAMPSPMGTKVADRNGSRVARRNSQNGDSVGFTCRPVSFDSCSM